VLDGLYWLSFENQECSVSDKFILVLQAPILSYPTGTKKIRLRLKQDVKTSILSPYSGVLKHIGTMYTSSYIPSRNDTNPLGHLNSK
jgi:hypothetical protein